MEEVGEAYALNGGMGQQKDQRKNEDEMVGGDGFVVKMSVDELQPLVSSGRVLVWWSHAKTGRT